MNHGYYNNTAIFCTGEVRQLVPATSFSKTMILSTLELQAGDLQVRVLREKIDYLIIIARDQGV